MIPATTGIQRKNWIPHQACPSGRQVWNDRNNELSNLSSSYNNCPCNFIMSCLIILVPDIMELPNAKKYSTYKFTYNFSQKIWSDCLKCPKFPECEEVAVIKMLR
jgi:hypothetical protein